MTQENHVRRLFRRRQITNSKISSPRIICGSTVDFRDSNVERRTRRIAATGPETCSLAGLAALLVILGSAAFVRLRLLALPLERRLRFVIQYLREETGSAAA